MAPVIDTLSAMLALGATASAMVMDPSPFGAHTSQSQDDLISFAKNKRDAIDDVPVIRAAESPNILKPIRPSKVSTLSNGPSIKAQATNDDVPAAGIRHDHVLRWAGESGTMAELKIRLRGDAEGLVDMEQFGDAVESMECHREGEGEIRIRFKEQADLDTAAEIWDAINIDDEKHFVLMVGDGDCGWNEDRILYHVSGVKYNDDKEEAILDARSVTWKEAIHTYDLDIGKITEEDRALVSRDWSPSVNVPLEADLSGKGFTMSVPGVDFLGTCEKCSVTGSFDIEGHFSVDWFELDEASVTLSTPGIDTTAIVSYVLRGEIFGKTQSKAFPFFKFSPAGVAIPGIVTIGPVVAVELIAKLYAIKGGVNVTAGGTATIPPSTATIDFLNEDGNTSDGWEVENKPEPLAVDAFVEARAAIILGPSLGVEISALETGFAFKLAAETPGLYAILRLIDSFTCTACGKFDSAIQGSIEFMTLIGVEVQKKVGGTFTSLWSLSFWNATSPPLAQFCEAIDEATDKCVNPPGGNWTSPKLY